MTLVRQVNRLLGAISPRCQARYQEMLIERQTMAQYRNVKDHILHELESIAITAMTIGEGIDIDPKCWFLAMAHMLWDHGYDELAIGKFQYRAAELKKLIDMGAPLELIEWQGAEGRRVAKKIRASQEQRAHTENEGVA